MVKLKAARLLTILVVVFCATPLSVQASDSEPDSLKNDSPNDVSVTGSAASFDKRLPPVIPGEQIQHNGRKMRVWSTSGAVPVGQVPQPPQAPVIGNGNTTIPNLGGVIVDNRPDSRR